MIVSTCHPILIEALSQVWFEVALQFRQARDIEVKQHHAYLVT